MATAKLHQAVPPLTPPQYVELLPGTDEYLPATDTAQTDPSHTLHAALFPNALYHSASYFIIGALRLPNGVAIAGQIVDATRKVFERLGEIDIDRVAGDADISIYERGWTPHKA